MDQMSVSITKEDKQLLIEEAHKKTLDTGKRVSIGKLVYEQIKPYLTSLRNGDSPDTKQTIEQTTKQDNEQPTQAPANRNMMDFSDLDLD